MFRESPVTPWTRFTPAASSISTNLSATFATMPSVRNFTQNLLRACGLARPCGTGSTQEISRRD
jgi:hypothetical protein